MSRLFIIFLIALLPLRGWSVERMAVHMAASESAAQAMALGSEHAAMPDDCPMLIKAGASDKGAQHGDGKVQRGCQSCQLCMSLAAPQAPAVKALSCGPLAALAARADRFASADLPRAAKPPIS